MRVGIVADTHIPSVARDLPFQVARAFEGVDLILHAGDIYAASCLDWLERIAPVVAVEDGASPYFDGDPRVADKQVVELGGYTVGMIHDLMLPGMASEVWPGRIAAEHPPDGSIPMSMQRLFGGRIDIVVFGHTHVAVVEEHQGVLFVNPGSPTLPRHMQELGTVAIMELTAEGRKAEIVDLAQFS